MKRKSINTPVLIAIVATVLILIAVLVTCSRGDRDCDSAPAVVTLDDAALISVVDDKKPGGGGGGKSSGKKPTDKKPAPAKSKKPGRSVVGVTAGVGASRHDDDCDD